MTKQIMAFVTMALLVAILAGTTTAQERPSLVEYLLSAEVTASDLSADQMTTLEAIRSDPLAIDVRIGQASPDAVRDTRALSLALPAPQGTGTDVTVSFDAMNIDLRTDQDYSLHSRDESSGSEVSLVVMGLDMSGTITSNGEVYKVHPLGDGLTAVYRYDTSQLQDHPPDYYKFIEEEQSRHDAMPEDGDPPSIAADSGAVIDVLVAYTARARAAAGNINTLIQLAIDESNQIYGNSQIRPRLRLVHSYQTGYTESDSMRNRPRSLDRDRRWLLG